MTVVAVPLANGILHYSLVDAVFRTLDNKPIAMEFHHYLGPFFMINDKEYMPEPETPEWDHLWKQFNGWYRAKGPQQVAGTA